MKSYLLTALTALLLAANLPLGALRHGYERYTYGWYFYLLLSLPVVIYLRVKTGYEWRYVPLLVAGVAAGQFLGGLLGERPRCGEDEWQMRN